MTSQTDLLDKERDESEHQDNVRMGQSVEDVPEEVLSDEVDDDESESNNNTSPHQGIGRGGGRGRERESPICKYYYKEQNNDNNQDETRCQVLRRVIGTDKTGNARCQYRQCRGKVNAKAKKVEVQNNYIFNRLNIQVPDELKDKTTLIRVCRRHYLEQLKVPAKFAQYFAATPDDDEFIISKLKNIHRRQEDTNAFEEAINNGFKELNLDELEIHHNVVHTKYIDTFNRKLKEERERKSNSKTSSRGRNGKHGPETTPPNATTNKRRKPNPAASNDKGAEESAKESTEEEEGTNKESNTPLFKKEMSTTARKLNDDCERRGRVNQGCTKENKCKWVKSQGCFAVESNPPKDYTTEVVKKAGRKKS